MPFLVAGSADSEHPLVQSSRSPDRVLAVRRMDVGNGEESSVAGEDNSAAGQTVGGPHLRPRNRRREMQ